MSCVMIVTEASFFGDYGTLDRGFQSIFGGDHGAHQRVSHHDSYGSNEVSFGESSYDNIRLGDISVGSGIRRGGGHRNGGRRKGNKGRKEENSSKNDKSKSSKENEDLLDITTESNINKVNLDQEKTHKWKDAKEKSITKINDRLDQAYMGNRPNDLQYNVCPHCGGIPKYKTKEEKKAEKKEGVDTCKDCISLKMFGL